MMVAIVFFWMHMFIVSTFTSGIKQIYVNEGGTVNISCPLAGVDVGWVGPPNSRNLYTHLGGRISAPDYIDFYNDTLLNHSVMKIHNFTLKDEGIYICDNIDGDYKVKLIMKRGPTDMLIENQAKDRFLYGSVDKAVELICRVTSGKPAEQLAWYKEAKELNRGGPGFVMYELKPTDVIHKQTYTCKALDTRNITLLQRNVQLYIFDKPKILIQDKLQAKEGGKVTQTCTFESNDPNATVLWFKDNVTFRDPLTLPNASRNDSGTFTCYVETRGGNIQHEMTISVQYPPDVSINPIDTNNLSKSVLLCRAKGKPNNITFLEWEQKTELGHHIQYLNGLINGTLTILHPNASSSYFNSGIYICRAKNGITGNDGMVVKSASHVLKIKGKPYFLQKSERTQFGIFGEMTNITTYIHCYPEYNAISALDSRGNDLLLSDNRYGLFVSTTTLQDDIRGQTVLVTVQKIDITISQIEMQDFRNLTIKVSNDISSTEFNVGLESASRPQPPYNVTGKAHVNTITVTFKPGFDGGYQQTFVLQYCPLDGISTFIDRMIEDDGHLYSAELLNLEYSTLYHIRMYSYNEINQSNVSEDIYVITSEEPVNFDLLRIVITLLLMLVFGVTVGFILLRYRDVQNNMNTVNNEMYSSIDRRHNVQLGQNVTYSIANQQRRLESQAGLSRCQQHESIRDVSRRNAQGCSSLNYIDVCFTNSQPRFYIHGKNERTQYVDIDFSLKAEPLPESESESGDDDFMNEEDVENLKK